MKHNFLIAIFLLLFSPQTWLQPWSFTFNLTIGVIRLMTHHLFKLDYLVDLVYCLTNLLSFDIPLLCYYINLSFLMIFCLSSGDIYLAFRHFFRIFFIILICNCLFCDLNFCDFLILSCCYLNLSGSTISYHFFEIYGFL